MDTTFGSTRDTSIHQIVEDLLGERIEALAGWIQELDAQVRATSAAGDEKTLKELRRALESWSKRDPKFEERLTDRVDVLADRLATLSSAVNTTAAAHAGSDGEIATLRRELEQETAKLHALLRDRAPSEASGREIEELRAAVAQLTGTRARGRSDDRHVTGLQEKVDNLAERIDTLAKTVATTAAGLAGREGELAALRKALEDGDARLEGMLAGLRRDEARSELRALEAQVSALAQKVASTSAHVAKREQDTAALRTRVEEGTAQAVAVANQLQGSLESLRSEFEASKAGRVDPATVASLEGRVGEIGARLQTIDGGLAAVGTRLDAVATTVEDASADVSAKELELAALQRHLEETSVRVDSALAELREASAALPEVASLSELEELARTLTDTERRLADVERTQEAAADEAVLTDVSRRVDELAGEQAALLAEIARTRDAALAESARLEALFVELPKAVASDEARISELAEALAQASASWDDERASVREQLDAMVVAVAETPAKADVEQLVAAVSGRVEELAAEQAELLAEITRTRDQALAESTRLDALLGEVPKAFASDEARISELAERLAQASASWDEERASVREQLDAMVVAVAGTAAKTDVEELVADVSGRVEKLATEQAALLAEISRARNEALAESTRLEALLAEIAEPATPIPPSEDKELERLLTAFADRIEAMENEREQIAAEATRVSHDGLQTVHELQESLQGRLSEAERRLAALEDAPAVVAPPAAPLPGDGRFRVELRALELRMQHAEAAARENREAVLVQLERLASRIEWRLQRLESSEQAEPKETSEEEELGQVVPIRGSIET